MPPMLGTASPHPEPRRNSSSPRKRRRSLGSWLIRTGLAVAAAWVAVSSLSASLATVLAGADPATAHKLAPSDGRFTAMSVAAAFSLAPEQASDSKQARQALLALRQDATAVEALSVLGIQAQLRADAPAASALFQHSTRLTRRELQPHLWSIEQEVARGDIPAALSNYDAALRSSASAQRNLLPVLINATSEPRVTAALAPVLLTRPVWAERFLQQATRKAPAPLAIAALLDSLAQQGYPVTDMMRANVIRQLAANALHADAWRYYAALRKGVDRRQSRDSHFALQDENRTPFDWVLGSAEGLSAGFIPASAVSEGTTSGILDFSLPPGRGATVASQEQWLPAGRYRLNGRSFGIDGPASTRPYWALKCRGGQELGRVQITPSPDDETAFSGEFTVPGDCPIQTLSLVARAVDGIEGSSGQIREVQLAPLP